MELQKLSSQVTERKGFITNEEMTKQSLIIPFLQRLGYDVFNPLEVRPEYVSDFGAKKGEKVDYAIFKNGIPIIFIEAKAVTEKLDKHSAQLSRYFNATPEVKIAILTNGVEYKFFTDLNQDNIMDDQPFFSFHMENMSSVDMESIESFTREQFDAEGLVKYAEELVYMSNLNSNLKELFRNPSDEFLRFLIKDFSNSRITSNVLERFRPIVKKAISNTLLEIISEGLSPRDVVAATAEDAVAPESSQAEAGARGAIITTEDELKSYEIVKEALTTAGRDVSALHYKDTTGYFTIYNRVITKWMLRINLDGSNKYVVTRLSVEDCAKLAQLYEVEAAPKSLGESRIRIQSVDDLLLLEELLVVCFDGVK
nr:type I restriction endonuclease [Tumebacillus amylolyticus]